MLEDRGYSISDTLPRDKDEWLEKNSKLFNNTKIQYYCKVQFEIDTNNKGGVLFLKAEKVGVGELTYFTNISIKNEWKNCILVTQCELTCAAKKEINDNLKHLYNIEYFPINIIQNNITHHHLVPKHSRMSDDEKEKLIKMYNADPNRFPSMESDDPISRYYGFRVGDMIRVQRSPKEISYRYVNV
jgi:DNA-directed RNA polymerase I, II, and III subunit RPABC1